MSGTRLDKWKEPRKAGAFIVSPDDHEVIDIYQRRWAERTEEEKKEQSLSSWSIFTLAKETIFDIKDEKPIFHIILHTLNTENFEIEITHALDRLVEGDNPEEIKEEVKWVLAYAIALDVPVYPNSEELGATLAQYYRDLMVEGLKARDESGEYKHYVMTDSSGTNIETIDHLEQMKLTDIHSSAELHLIREAVRTEIAKRDEAGQILNSLRLAISELSDLLYATKRNENALQRCLTRNPILFGTEYTRVIPKHRLGAEYEMDYALQRVSGLVDLVEIEASVHPLFNQNGDPSKHLVHAEQQVLDWLDWIECYSSYARDRLPGLVQPLAYVVIGRSQDLSNKEQERLRRRNITFRGTFYILTYDDLLDNARNLLRVLEGKASG